MYKYNIYLIKHLKNPEFFLTAQIIFKKSLRLTLSLFQKKKKNENCYNKFKFFITSSSFFSQKYFFTE